MIVKKLTTKIIESEYGIFIRTAKSLAGREYIQVREIVPKKDTIREFYESIKNEGYKLVKINFQKRVYLFSRKGEPLSKFYS
jgi:hypothetical protein